MKEAPDALLALLQSGDPLFMSDLYTITRQSGSALRWTNADIDLTVSGNLFGSGDDQGTTPLVSRGSIRNARGTEVATCDLTLYCGQTAQLLGVRLPLAAHNGAFDAARVRLDRYIAPAATPLAGWPVVLFEGAVASVDPSALEVVLHLKSDLELLNRVFPVHTYQERCTYTFGCPGCGKSLSALTESATAAAGSDRGRILTSLGHAANYFAGGYCIATSGNNAGARRSIAVSTAAGAITLDVPFPAEVATGDGFQAVPGCARTKDACSAWGNLPRFRGFPFIPVAETAK
jgi:uncharacterized phage protein (TIGR02218 family)